jgi:hypothetical protein
MPLLFGSGSLAACRFHHRGREGCKRFLRFFFAPACLNFRDGSRAPLPREIALDKVLLLYVCSASMMKPYTLWLSTVQIAKVKALSKRTGIKASELIRRFIDEGLSKKK